MVVDSTTIEGAGGELVLFCLRLVDVVDHLDHIDVGELMRVELILKSKKD